MRMRFSDLELVTMYPIGKLGFKDEGAGKGFSRLNRIESVEERADSLSRLLLAAEMLVLHRI